MENKFSKINKDSLDMFFSGVLENSEKDPELKILLEQKDLEEGKTIFELIKRNLLRHEEKDPKDWYDETYYYGHVGIKLNDQNKDLAQKIFIIPDLNIKITVGKTREMPDGLGMRLVWEKFKK
jgi:hypothetical protein